MGTGEIISIIFGTIAVISTVVGFFLKRAFSQLDEKASKTDMKALECRVEEHNKSIGDIKTNYLTKDDFFREQAKTDRKLDEIMRILLDIKGGVKNG
jgi:hypothetical protein